MPAPHDARGGHLILPLPRPEYPAVPEVLTTSLALEAYGKGFESADGGPTAHMYRLEPGAGGKLVIAQTEPRDDADLDRFASSLRAAGVWTEASDRDLSRAVANSLAGIRTKKGSQPASPLTPSVALLQDLKGMLARANPPAVEGILECMFGMGASVGDDTTSASQLWADAVTVRLAQDPVLAAIDEAVSEALLTRAPNRTSATPKQLLAGLECSGLVEQSPFSWFRSTWSVLCSDEWVQAVPARPWSDWASTVLRMAFGLGFAWEASWYVALSKAVLEGGPQSWESIRGRMEPTLQWRASEAGPSVRDVASPLRGRVIRATHLRSTLDAWIDSSSGARGEPVPQVIEAMHADRGLQATLIDILAEKPRETSAASNRWEAVRYSLLIRTSAADAFPDYYGLLRTVKPRFLVPDPGTEWVAMMASLSCGRPDGRTTVRTLASKLAELGLEPKLSDLIRLLEDAGLARGSADADQAVIVESAFHG